MLLPSHPYEQVVGAGLVLRSLAGERDVERLATFNGHIHGAGVGALAHALIREHPATRPAHWLYIEDTTTGQIVSSLCLLPWVWRYEDVTLRAGEMGLVGTLEPYRRRGLIRMLNERFTVLLNTEGFDLSHIQGIPYFYRQFGYEYAIPLEAWWRVEHHLIPDTPAATPYQMRQAALDDFPALMRLYDEAAQTLGISAVREEAIWRYLLGPSLHTEQAAETWLVRDAHDAPTGYVRIARHGFGDGLIVNETSGLSADAALALLRWLKTLAIARARPYVRLNLPANSTLVQLARRYGAHDGGAYAWQIRLLDGERLLKKLAPVLERLLKKLAPVLERRIAASPFAGLTQALRLNLYRQVLALQFVAGRLTAVSAEAAGVWGDVRVPPPLLAPLLLGYRSFDELRAYHDVSADGMGHALVDALFPPQPSFLYSLY